MRTLNIPKPVVAALLIIAVISAELAFGLLPPKKAYAGADFITGGTLDAVLASHTAVDTPRVIKENVLNPIARSMAQIASTIFLRSLTDWVRSGFKGEPQFVKDPDKFFKRLVGQALLNHNLRTAASALCYPFGNGRAGITIPDIPGYPQLKCTVKDPTKIGAFFDDFNQGGWDMWNQVLEPQNNFYGQLSLLSEARNFEVSDKRKQGELEQVASQGFLGIKNCAINVVFDKVVSGKPFKSESCAQYHNVTPGSIVKSKLEEPLGKGEFQKWINVHELSDLISTLITSTVNRLIGTKFMCLSCASKTSAASETKTLKL